MGTDVVARLAGGAAERGDAAPRVVAVRVAAHDESLGYVRLVVGKTASPDGSHTGDGPLSGDDGSSGARDGSSAGDDVFDVELLFWDDDEVVNVRVAARDAPKTGRWSLSYVDGLKYTKNAARDLAEELRIALGWEVLPVISEFDPRFNNSKRLWFEKASTSAASTPPSWIHPEARTARTVDDRPGKGGAEWREGQVASERSSKRASTSISYG